MLYFFARNAGLTRHFCKDWHPRSDLPGILASRDAALAKIPGRTRVIRTKEGERRSPLTPPITRLVSSGWAVASANYVPWLARRSNLPLSLAGKSRVRILPRWEAPTNRLSEFTT